MNQVCKRLRAGPLLAACLLVVGGTSWCATASAAIERAGVVVTIKHAADGKVFVATTDERGELRIAGLAAGDYAVSIADGVAPPAMKVGLGGKLALAAGTEVASSGEVGTRRVVEQIAFDNAGSDEHGVLSAKRKGLVDVSISSADWMLEGTSNSNDAAAFIIADRRKNGLFKDPLDFARRICPNVDIDFKAVRIQVGDTMIVTREGEPDVSGFQCVRGSGEMRILNLPQRYTANATPSD